MTRQLVTIFNWQVWRYARGHKLLALLNILSIALGVAVYLSIQIANHSANRSFAAAVDLVSGRAHLEVRGEIDETLFPIVAAAPEVEAATPVVDGIAILPAWPGEYLRIAGIDLLSSPPFATAAMKAGDVRFDFEKWAGEPGQIAITEEFAARHQLQVGSNLEAIIHAKPVQFEIAALIDTKDSPAGAQPRFAMMDIGWAQELFGQVGRLSSIQLLLEEPAKAEETAARLQTLLRGNVTVQAPQQRSSQMRNMVSAFQLNLTALSLVSLLVGSFLIYNTISASVARRRAELGVLRALGATQNQIRMLFLGEATLFGLIGIALGGFGGVALARVTTEAVEITISSLYVLVDVDRRYFDPLHFLVSGTLGLGAVIVGAWYPASAAAKVEPVQALNPARFVEHTQPRPGRWLLVSLVSLVIAVGSAWLALNSDIPEAAFVSAFFVLAGFAALSPDCTSASARLFERASSGLIALVSSSSKRIATLWRLSADRLHRSLQRNAVTVASLATAVAMTVGLTVMIHSFRDTVSRWIGQSVIADIYVAPASNEIVGLDAVIPSGTIEWLQRRPEIDSVDAFREVKIDLSVNGKRGPALLAVIDSRYRGNLDLKRGADADAIAKLISGDAILVSESLARKFGVSVGDELPLGTPGGETGFHVAGIYRDYTRDQGVIMMTVGRFLRHWSDTGPNSLAVYLKPGVEAEPVIDQFIATQEAGQFAAYSNRSLSERIMRIFDQTFAVTGVLRGIALIVAVLGIALSVVTLVAERQRETGMLRAIGASSAQVSTLFTFEAAMIGLVASVLGIPAGLALAGVLTWVVNPAFFGWTIDFSIPWGGLASIPLLIVPAAAVASWWPARQAARANLAEAVREE